MKNITKALGIVGIVGSSLIFGSCGSNTLNPTEKNGKDEYTFNKDSLEKEYEKIVEKEMATNQALFLAQEIQGLNNHLLDLSIQGKKYSEESLDALKMASKAEREFMYSTYFKEYETKKEKADSLKKVCQPILKEYNQMKSQLDSLRNALE